MPPIEHAAEDQIFTAAQILCGNLDDSLNEATRRGDAILELLESAPDEDRPNKRLKPDDEQPEASNWSLATAATLLIREFSQLEDHSSQRSSLATWLGVAQNNPATIPFWSLFQNALISMAHLDIANDVIEQSLDKKGTMLIVQQTSASSEPMHHIAVALQYWPTNPSALLLAANVCRMSGTNLQKSLDMYRAAIKCAHVTTKLARTLLEDETSLSQDDKFLVDTVLCQSAQEDDDKDGESQVLVTASYMAALLASCLGQHDLAADLLLNFSSANNRVTRIHPNVWDTGLHHNNDLTKPCSTTVTPPVSQGAFCPWVFPDTIPQDLFDLLRDAFRSDGPYWAESGYDRNVYYSFWTDYPLPCTVKDADRTNSCTVGNAVEHYIVAHVLPRVQSAVRAKGQHIKGFEWWVHTRPHGANLGHQLHFDTDEALLEQDGTVEFPIAATVTYLTLDVVPHGATILFDQTPSSKTNGEHAYMSFPKSRSLLVFPGDLLHGVLPCISMDPNKVSDASSPATDHQRLTFMVNFWGYRIPDRITKRTLYGPSDPLPPPTKEHSWVQEISRGYPQTIPLSPDTIRAPENSGLVAVSPAWDTIITDRSSHSSSIDDEWIVSLESSLNLPASSGIQQRFFVTNAPEYFHSTLLEK